MIKGDGGQPIPFLAYGRPQAYILPEAAKWSPTGRQLAYRRMVDHRIELWVADRDTLRSERIADGVDQVVDFAWSTSGVLIFSTGLNYSKYETAIKDEADHGWLLDGRVPLFTGSFIPTPPTCGKDGLQAACSTAKYAYTPDRGTRPATPVEAQTLEEATTAASKPNFAANRGDGMIASAEVIDPAQKDGVGAIRQITLNSDSAAVRCPARECKGSWFKSIGWARHGRSVVFVKYEDSAGALDGSPKDQTAIYEWNIATRQVRKITRGDKLLEDCHPSDAVVYCAEEATTAPRRLVRINLDTGIEAVIADPNPTFSTKTFPRIDHLRANDLEGNAGFADLVYPLDYVPGRRYPLVIVQYRSRGFLRGGTGDEFPILPLSAAGFFVLSTNKPENWQQYHVWNSEAVDRFDYSDGLRGRRRQLSFLTTLMDRLVASGLVDNSRIAITGLSAGAEILHYSLQHSDRFATAIASGGAHDETFLALVPEGAELTHLMNMLQTNHVVARSGEALDKLAWSARPECLRTPLLVNVGEYEAMLGFEGLAALRDTKRPVEARVFPDEAHIKYHPRTFRGLYDNNMAWLRFWLMGEKNPEPEFHDQYVRWEAMRAKLEAERAARTNCGPSDPGER